MIVISPGLQVLATTFASSMRLAWLPSAHLRKTPSSVKYKSQSCRDPAVEAAFRHTFELIKEETYKISHLHWALKTAAEVVAFYHFKWSGLINGAPASGGGRGTSFPVPRSPFPKLGVYKPQPFIL